MHISLTGYLPYEQDIKLIKGSSYADLLKVAVLYEDSDTSVFSEDYPLYDGLVVELKKQDDRLININTADKESLITLPGIGDKTADKIIEYRNKTPFHCKEDIIKINGIGEKKYEELKELISV
ncbi:MAG: ComEA family DNA-binding protein [Erysipelotrichaceae bacterium]